MKIAIDIKTEDWNNIINVLICEGWEMKSKYDSFDAGIDFDFLILTKGVKKITFAWDNWNEGEIKCSDRLFEELSNKFSINFTFGPPNSLKRNIIILTKFQSFINKFRGKDI